MKQNKASNNAKPQVITDCRNLNMKWFQMGIKFLNPNVNVAAVDFDDK